jgi:AhpD family alkylhydroperoxidase
VTVRLPIVSRGVRPRQRLFIRVTRLLGSEVNDVGKLVMHRPRFFGEPFLAVVRQVMRGASAWSAGEREVIATAVSRANDCPFCVGIHGTLVEQLAERGNPRVDAACHFVEKLTREPEAMTADDVANARAAGVTDEALGDAIDVAFVFNVINRIANALDFSYGSDRQRQRAATLVRYLEYRLPSVLLR